MRPNRKSPPFIRRRCRNAYSDEQHTVANSANPDSGSAKKLDAIEKAHQDMLNAKKQLHDAMED